MELFILAIAIFVGVLAYAAGNYVGYTRGSSKKEINPVIEEDEYEIVRNFWGYIWKCPYCDYIYDYWTDKRTTSNDASSDYLKDYFHGICESCGEQLEESALIRGSAKYEERKYKDRYDWIRLETKFNIKNNKTTKKAEDTGKFICSHCGAPNV